MSKIGSKILLSMMKGFGRQPWWLLHFEADVISGFMYALGGYRKKIVTGNLEKVFGKEKASKLSKGFYRWNCRSTR